MSLPDINLDDREFADLVHEARLRAARACPEWNPQGVGDPGVALIETFAWLTDLLLYRLNRLPEKIHLRLLELLGIRLEAPIAATANVRFMLGSEATKAVRIAAQTAEVATPASEDEASVVFQVAREVTIPKIEIAAFNILGDALAERAVTEGRVRLRGDDRMALGVPPKPGHAILLGFEAPLDDLVLRLTVECAPARRAGGDPFNPPLAWEVSSDTGAWIEAEVLADSTSGFELGDGTVDLQMPARPGTFAMGGRRLHWLRCRVLGDDDVPATYTYPPQIESITAGAVGALVPVVHASAHGNEVLGTSDGTPGQTFKLAHAPVLPLEPGERIEVRSSTGEGWEAWEPVSGFADSENHARHFMLDRASGTVEFGPAIAVHGSWQQYGAVPVQGAAIQMAAYRHGGGRAGNVEAGRLTVLRGGPSQVVSVTNPAPASGGMDPETVENARRRAALEFRTRLRAVTANDYEVLSVAASPLVARARCEPVSQDGVVVVEIRLVPMVDVADRMLLPEELVPDDALLAEVAEFLDERRTLGAIVSLKPVRFRWVLVVVSVRAKERADARRVEDDILHRLFTYVNPLIGGSLSGQGTGWTFGRALNQGELYGLVESVEGVDYVEVLRLYEAIDTADSLQVAAEPAGSRIDIGPAELVASAQHVVRVQQAVR